MNWPNTFKDRLFAWSDLRKKASTLPLLDALNLINNWWAQAPTIPHYLHIADPHLWPTPWQLLADDVYCELAKCVGMGHTILLSNQPKVHEMTIKELDNGHILTVNKQEFVLNYYPDDVQIDVNFETFASIDAVRALQKK